MSHAAVKTTRLSATAAVVACIDTDVDSGSETTADLSVSLGSAAGELLSRPSSPGESVTSCSHAASQFLTKIHAPATPSLPSCTTPLPSVGSVLHGTGECRPCAWFWKPQGCSNGEECRHCHMCPEGTIKARKLAKIHKRVETERLDSQACADGSATASGPSTTHETDFRRVPERISAALEVLPIWPDANVGASDGKISEAPVVKDTQKEEDTVPLGSVGSLLHGTGECKPCAWFWKPSGCENGVECSRCHLCPDGEVKNRKKARKAAQRMSKQECTASDDSLVSQTPVKIDLLACASLPEASASFLPEAVSFAGIGPQKVTCLSPRGLTLCTLSIPDERPLRALNLAVEAGQRECESQPLDEQPSYTDLASAIERFMTASIQSVPALETPNTNTDQDVQADSSEESDAITNDRASIGSAGHATGTCSPCAWFWKPQGCQNGVDCRRCHLCTPSDAKMRKKAKHNAMRQAAQ